MKIITQEADSDKNSLSGGVLASDEAEALLPDLDRRAPD